MRRLLGLTLLLTLSGFGAARAAPHSALHYRFIGPPGNRTDAVAGVPGQPFKAYVGAASGGLWKTTDGGTHWKPVFQGKDVQSIGAVTVAPSAPNEVWVGTGETFYIRPQTSIGNGVWFSHDGGRHWKHLGLDGTGRIGRIVVDPHDPKTVYVCAAGSGFGKSTHRGVYETTDAGRNWKKVLYVGPHTGCSDLAMDPRDPRTLFAGMWQFDIHPWDLDSGGPNGGVFVTHDAGAHWHKVAGGLPGGAVGKIGVRFAPSHPQTVYALISLENGPGLYRSDDGGEHWHLVSRHHSMLERPPYYGRFAVAPNDPDRLYFVSVHLSRSRDGGKTIHFMRCGCGDTHAIWIDPNDAGTIWVADDIGVVVTHDGGKDWHRMRLPVAQMYHAYTDNDVPYHVMGNRQDGFSYYGPSDSLTRFGITPGDWHEVGGCESGFTVPDPSRHAVWSGCYEGGVTRFDLDPMHGQDVRVWPVAGFGSAAKNLKNRWNWTMPLAVASWAPHPVFAGSQYVYRTTNGGHSWKRISPDLTRDVKAHEGPSGGIVRDAIGTFTSAALSIIAPSDKRAGVIWTGSYDGRVSITRDHGKHWTNVTPGLLRREGGAVSSITPSPFKAGVAWLTVDRHLLGDSAPYIFRTGDYGRHWHRVNGGIPHSVFSYVHTVAADPSRKGLLFAGTENGVYVSFDGGGHWQGLQANLPHAPVYWLTVQPEFHDLVAATFGRGFWILDDVKPLETAGAAALAPSGKPKLLPPRVAWRFRLHNGTPGPADGSVVGANPPYGAIIDYRLPDKPGSQATLAIENDAGDVVRRFHAGHGGKLTMKPGLNRITWNLRRAPVPKAKLLRPPPQAPWAGPAKGGTRHIVSWDLDLTQRGPLVQPGQYRVVLTVDGQRHTQPLEIRKDPHTRGTKADIAAQTRLARDIYADLETDVQTIDAIESLRQQLHDLKERLSGNVGRHKDALAAVDDARSKLVGIEGHLFDIYLTGAREDAFRQPMQSFGRLSALLRQVEDASSDNAPTEQQMAAFKVLDAKLHEHIHAFDAFRKAGLSSLNATLRGDGVHTVGLP